MPRHPEVLTDIADAAAEFTRCQHRVDATLTLEDGTVLSQQRNAFAIDETKTPSRVFSQQPHPVRAIRELQGEERDSAIARLKRETMRHDRLIAVVGTQEIPLAGASMSLALYQHRGSGELWVGKSDVGDGGQLCRAGVLKERVANDVYAYYGVSVPRLAVAELPCCYRTPDTQQLYGDEDGLTHASHLMSRWLDRFTTCPEQPNFTTSSTQPEYQLCIDDQLIPERGLGRILAVAHFVHDVDVTNLDFG